MRTESPEGIVNADEIYALPGVDAIFVGPNDLYWQMKAEDGTPPTPDEYEAALQAVLAAGKKAGTPVGLHATSVEEVQQRVAEGWKFMAIKSELRMMVEQADHDVRALGLNAADDLARY
jgi:4-hydroxy-2-oxoheptanedioate aldolase